MKPLWRWLSVVSEVGLALMLTGCAGTNGTGFPDLRGSVQLASYMPVGQQVVPPHGFIGFCLRSEPDCAGGTDTPSNPALTPARWSELNDVNDYVNRLPEIEDSDNYGRTEYWTYPNERGGDCEDLALLKRKLLIARGWPADAVLLATAQEWNGEGHALLVVVTDKGDFVLDNKNPAIVSWRDAPYTWKARQSRARPYVWVDLDRDTFRNAAMETLPPLGATAPFILAARRISGRAERDGAARG